MKEVYKYLLGGDWIESNDIIEVINPYDNEIIAEVHVFPATEIEHALAVAAEGAKEIAAMPAHERSDLLFDAAEGILKRKTELSHIIALEAGKPIKQAQAEIERAAIVFKIAAEETKRIYGELQNYDSVRAGENRWGITRRFPRGVILGICPFNFPLNLVSHKVAPALAASNAIIIKPASKTPISALTLGEILYDVGLPKGVFSVLPCSGRTAFEMLDYDGINMVTFTGSAEVGWGIKAKVSHLPVTLELGGNAAVIVHNDIDSVEEVALRCAQGAFAYAGQICISVQRIYVQKNIYNTFLGAMIDSANNLTVGDPLEEETFIGPIIDQDSLMRINSLVKSAIEKGAKVHCGGEMLANCYLPTVLTGTNSAMAISNEEAFAPIVCVEPYNTFEEALSLVNESRYGLQAGVYTKDFHRIWQAFDTLKVGGVIINDYPTFRVDAMPYGGVKDSGFGREGVRYAIEEMTELKLLVLKNGQQIG